jgi:hypothetical protein
VQAPFTHALPLQAVPSFQAPWSQVWGVFAPGLHCLAFGSQTPEQTPFKQVCALHAAPGSQVPIALQVSTLFPAPH